MPACCWSIRTMRQQPIHWASMRGGSPGSSATAMVVEPANALFGLGGPLSLFGADQPRRSKSEIVLGLLQWPRRQDCALAQQRAGQADQQLTQMLEPQATCQQVVALVGNRQPDQGAWWWICWSDTWRYS